MFAWRHLEMIGTCPSAKIRNRLWYEPHLTSTAARTAPATWFGTFNNNYLQRMRNVTHALVTRFLQGVKKYNGWHPIEFILFPANGWICDSNKGNAYCNGVVKGCHASLGQIRLCDQIFWWNEDEEDDGKQGSRTHAAKIVVHELLHKLYPSQVSPTLTDQMIPPPYLSPAAEDNARWLVDPVQINPPRPDLATLNNDSYAEWFGHLFLSIEKHCGLWTSPVGVDGNVTYYYSDGKWTTSLP